MQHLQPGRYHLIQRGILNLRHLCSQQSKSTLRDPLISENTTDTSVTRPRKGDDTPVQFSLNRQWHAVMNFKPIEQYESGNNWQAYSITLSFVIFMVYFCILREENDLDERLFKPLNKTVDVSLIDGSNYSRKKNLHPQPKD